MTLICNMLYVRDVRNSLLIAHDQGLVSDEELLLLKPNSSKKPRAFVQKNLRGLAPRESRNPSAFPGFE